MLIYVGGAFREQQGISLHALAKDLHVRRATLIDLERNRPGCINRKLIGRLLAYWRGRGLACQLEDLLVDVPDEPPPKRGAGEG